jgi:anti-sigma regulatory factor (Ser/Thr protein kinase)
VESLAGGVLPRDQVETAVLLTSEVVTNAITHGLGIVTVAITIVEGTMRVEVTDANPDTPRVSRDAGLAPTGRGMRLVDELSGAWGVTPLPDSGGKTVWFRVP